ncbi:MAG: hypothetical protein RJA49_2128 [Actinomycetota bacterium]
MTLPSVRALRWVAVALATAALAACSGSEGARDHGSSSASNRQLGGTFTITVVKGSDTPCAPIAERPDLTDGAPVVVADASGAVLVTGSLGGGTADGSACVRAIELAAVPALPSYQVSIGSYGPIDVTAEALDVARNRLDLRLGV